MEKSLPRSKSRLYSDNLISRVALPKLAIKEKRDFQAVYTEIKRWEVLDYADADKKRD